MAANVIEKSGVHKLLGVELQLRKLIIPPPSSQDPSEQYELDKLIIHGIPEDSSIDNDILSLFVHNRLHFHEDNCEISIVGDKALVTLPTKYTLDGEFLLWNHVYNCHLMLCCVHIHRT